MPAVNFEPKGLLPERGPTRLPFQRDPAVMNREIVRVRPLLSTMGQDVVFPEVTPISSQVGGSCVANSFVDGLEYLQGMDGTGRRVIQLSRSAAYYWSRCRHGGQNEDEGTYASSMAEQLCLAGVVPESEWAHSEEHLFQKVPDHLLMMAADNRLSGVMEVKSKGLSRCDDVEWNVRAGLPTSWGSTLTKSQWADPDPNAVIGPPDGVTWGNHQQLIVGVRLLANGKREFLNRNSWGRGWGDNGYIWISEECLMQGFGIYTLTLCPDLLL